LIAKEGIDETMFDSRQGGFIADKSGGSGMASEHDYTEKGAPGGRGGHFRLHTQPNVRFRKCRRRGVSDWVDRPQKRTLRGQPRYFDDILRFDIFSTSDAEPLLPPESLWL
jgi:hypothetical protein